jgi:hypothetical protein
MKLDLHAVRDELIRHLQEVIESVQKAELPAIENRIEITTAQIEDGDRITEIANTLPNEGNHIYWFEVNDSKTLLKQFSDRDRTKGYKLARDNKGTDSKYVYVGSCTQTKLSSRFKTTLWIWTRPNVLITT